MNSYQEVSDDMVRYEVVAHYHLRHKVALLAGAAAPTPFELRLRLFQASYSIATGAWRGTFFAPSKNRLRRDDG